MLDFVKKSFRKFFEFWLWLNLIVCTVAGGIIFHAIFSGSPQWILVGFVLVGFVVGLISNILIGGITATFLNIDDNLEKLKNKQ